MARRRLRLPQGDLTLAWLAVGATTFISLAVPLEMQRQWITVAWALEVAALAWIAERLRLPVFHRLIWALAALVAARLLVNPMVLSYPIGRLPLLNWLTYGYGLPAVAFAFAAWRCRRNGDPLLARVLEWGAMLFAWLLVTLQVRQFFHPGDLSAGGLNVYEAGSYVVAWLVGGLLLLRAALRRPETDMLRGAQLVLAAGALAQVLLPILALNPLWEPISVGPWRVINWLVPLYVLPAALLLLASRQLERDAGADRSWTKLLADTSLLSLFVWLSLEVRQLFHGRMLAAEGGQLELSLIEAATYGVAWLAGGWLARRAAMRWPSIQDLDLAGEVSQYIGLLAAVVWVGFIENPTWTGVEVGQYPLLNVLLYVYLLPAVMCLAIYADRRRTTEKRWDSELLLHGGLLLLFIWALTATRQLFHGTDLNAMTLAEGAELRESASYAMVLLAGGWLLLRAFRRWPAISSLGQAGFYAVWAGLGWALVGNGILFNPAWWHITVGTTLVVNDLLYSYGLPLLLALAIAAELQRQGARRPQIRAIGSAAILLAFILVILEVRQGFHGQFLDTPGSNSLERYAYSLSCTLFGLSLLAIGIARRLQLARYASLAVMLLAAAKVFLYDTYSLGGLYRVVSFLGLGMSLLFLAWLYQRFVFKELAGPVES